jgi:hypothetical protein
MNFGAFNVVGRMSKALPNLGPPGAPRRYTASGRGLR